MSISPNLLAARAPPTQSSLFPLSRGISSWTTFPGISGSLPLNNATLRPVNVASGFPIIFTNAPDGKLALKMHYPKGSYKPSAEIPGGISFYSHGPSSFDFTRAKETTFGYSIYFPSGFEWVKGGKLPGLFGGDSKEVAYGCSGGRKDIHCWSARLMWRTNGQGEIYAYLPPYDIPGFEANKPLCSAPKNTCDSTYGISIGRGNFVFATGGWTTVAERVRLNDAGKANGEFELYVDGRSVIQAKNIIIRPDNVGKTQGIFFQSFFGGSTSDWATPKDQDVYISDFSVAIIEALAGSTQARSLVEGVDNGIDEHDSIHQRRAVTSASGKLSPGWAKQFASIMILLQVAILSFTIP
ncbi:alginate lyase [Coprinopsis marcescibilis]|uniref:Alginate lyase n=1 Tax=Coprinopsis marcescibilis TaxID=230819 RepID=A0A5C3KQP7_COPMA|nr:alginate lyase [Coprinopsis marcescibilis]